jgi:hypothetical protein
MRKKILGTAIAMFLVLSLSVVGYANAYEMGFAWIQHRVYQNRTSVNKVVVAMKYDGSGDTTNENVVQNVTVFDSGDNELALGDVTIDTQNDTYPRFNSLTRDWEFFGFNESSYYGQEIIDELIPGENYRIVVETTDGDFHEAFYTFRGIVDLPIVKAFTFAYHFDRDGNFYWKWWVPIKMFYLDSSFFYEDDLGKRPQVRAMIEGYQNGEISHLMWIDVPYLMSGVYVPASWGFFDNNYDRVEIAVQVQIRDFSNRTYSNYRRIRIRIR